MKSNCWEVKRCGREPGGARAATRGVCLAASADHLDGANDGTNGGRICWQLRTNGGSLPGAPDCAGGVECLSCAFMRQVRQEQGTEFCFFPPPVEI